MRNTSALMIDLETMSTEPDAAIVSIGAVAFDPIGNDTVDSLSDRFYRTISLQTSMDAGRHISAGTLEWWFQQSPEAQSALFEGPAPMTGALVDFRMWADDLRPKVSTIWANDPDFDCVILREAFKAVGQFWPWHFSIHRSCRTIKDLAWPDGDVPDYRAGTTHHRADDDAAAQAVMVQLAHRKLWFNQNAA